MIIKPSNILYVTNKEELKSFHDEYAIGADCIEWSRVKAKYSGIAFTFRRVSELGLKTSDYWWHCGYDVESLCVWDLKSFDNKVIPIKFSK